MTASDTTHVRRPEDVRGRVRLRPMRVLKTLPKAEWPALGLSARTLVQAITPQGGPFAALLLSAAVAHALVFAGTGVLRAIYPFPIDGIEPGAIQEVRRVLAGQPIYVAPELGYVPFIYGPVYFYVSALLAVPTGSTLLGMRLVSLLASLGSIALVALLVRRETGRLSMGLVAGGLLAACGPQVDMAMDVGRMDALSLLFLLGAIYAARTAIFDPAARMAERGG